jgi:cytochrome P450
LVDGRRSRWRTALSATSGLAAGGFDEHAGTGHPEPAITPERAPYALVVSAGDGMSSERKGIRALTDSSSRAEIQFDHMSADFSRRSTEIFQHMHEKCPVAWSEAHGGYWVVSDYASVSEVSRDDARFSSHHDLDPESPYDGPVIPPAPEFMGFIEMDPPRSMLYRKPWQRWFSPTAVRRREARMQEVAAAVLDRVAESGQLDLVRDFASPVPAILVLEYLGLPVDDWELMADRIHSYLTASPSHPRFAEYAEGWRCVSSFVRDEVEKCRKSPRNDLLSEMVRVKVEGEPYSTDALHADVLNFVAGGVDTTTAVTSSALLYLGRNPEQRQLLVDEPDRRRLACEEFLRYFTPLTTLARTVTEDTELAGQTMRKGDRVLICWAGANLDGTEFTRPEEFLLDRSPNRHTSFGLGVHRCIGSSFARAEFLVMMNEILDRIPNYEIEEASVQRYETTGLINGYASIRARFEPTEASGRTI